LPSPREGKPFGAVFEGYINIPSKGRYRFFILGQGNFRFHLSNHVLLERWTGFEWRITSEREMKFSEPGWYPVRLEFFSSVQSFSVMLALESAGQEKRAISISELCYE
jgi:hypothetical protein